MRLTEQEYELLIGRRKGVQPIERKAITDHFPGTEKQATGRKPNKTELEYSRMLALEFPGCEISYEGMTFRMGNTHKYTPDWVVKHPGGLLLVEVKARGKNGFRQASYGRAKLAFDQAKVEWPMFSWRWAEKHNGSWNWG